MTAQGFNQSGFKSQEPSRPIFSGGNDAGLSPPRIDQIGNRRSEFETPAQPGSNGAPHRLMDSYGDENGFNVESPHDP